MKSIRVIKKHYEIFNKDPVEGVSIGFEHDIFKWDLIILGPKDSPYEGAIFDVSLIFPDNYPLYPPKLKFNTPIFHPNVYNNGEVCISILHPPGDDKYGYEKAEERWRPVHTVNSILLSVISLLHSPNDESPANVDAGKLWRENKQEFQNVVNSYIKKII